MLMVVGQLAHGDTRQIWEDISRSAAGVTLFHTPLWAEILEASFPSWRSAPLAIEFADGNIGLLPRIKLRWPLPFAGYAESMLPGVYGGPLFAHPPQAEQWQAMWDLVNGLHDLIIIGNPYLPYTGSPEGERRPMFTQSLDLTRGFDAVTKGFRKGHRADIKAAEKKGVIVLLATTADDINSYYEAYQESLERWGNQAGGFYPHRLFQNLFAHPEYGTRIKLWVARINGTLISGAWILQHREYAVYWHGASRAAYMGHHPAHLLVATAIREACASGSRWFDFNPSAGLDGVEHFKSGFGTQRLEFYAYRRLSLVGRGFRFYRYIKEHHFRQNSL